DKAASLRRGNCFRLSARKHLLRNWSLSWRETRRAKMADGPEAEFKIILLPGVSRILRELTSKAKRLRKKQRFLNCLRKVIDRLKDDPLGWGDPLYRAKKEGGTVCRGLLGPLLVDYVAYEAERVVFILSVQA